MYTTFSRSTTNGCYVCPVNIELWTKKAKASICLELSYQQALSFTRLNYLKVTNFFLTHLISKENFFFLQNFPNKKK